MLRVECMLYSLSRKKKLDLLPDEIFCLCLQSFYESKYTVLHTRYRDLLSSLEKKCWKVDGFQPQLKTTGVTQITLKHASRSCQNKHDTYTHTNVLVQRDDCICCTTDIL